MERLKETKETRETVQTSELIQKWTWRHRETERD